MLSVGSDPYNAFEQQLYGGRSLSGLRSRLMARARFNPFKGATRIGGTMSTLGEIYGGRVRKRPSKKQLLALARGRAKLRALRSMGKRRRRHYKGGAVSSEDVSLDDFKVGGKMKLSQDGVDRATLKAKKLVNKLTIDYGVGEPGEAINPGAYKYVAQLNRILNYIKKCEALGYESVYGAVDIPRGALTVLTNMQRSNKLARASKFGMKNVRALVRNILKNQNGGRNPTTAQVTKAIREGRVGMMNNYDDAEAIGFKQDIFSSWGGGGGGDGGGDGGGGDDDDDDPSMPFVIVN